MGRLKLRLFDATRSPLKPVYLRLEILEGRSQDQSGQSQGQIQGPDPGSLGPDPGPDPGSLEPDPGPVSGPVSEPVN